MGNNNIGNIKEFYQPKKSINYPPNCYYMKLSQVSINDFEINRDLFNKVPNAHITIINDDDPTDSFLITKHNIFRGEWSYTSNSTNGSFKHNNWRSLSTQKIIKGNYYIILRNKNKFNFKAIGSDNNDIDTVFQANSNVEGLSGDLVGHMNSFDEITKEEPFYYNEYMINIF